MKSMEPNEWRFCLFSLNREVLSQSEEAVRVAQEAIAKAGDKGWEDCSLRLEMERGAARRMKLDEVVQALAAGRQLEKCLERVWDNVGFDRPVSDFDGKTDRPDQANLTGMLDLELVGSLLEFESRMREASEALGPCLELLAGISDAKPAEFLGYRESSAHHCLLRFSGELVDLVVRSVKRGRALERLRVSSGDSSRKKADSQSNRPEPKGPDEVKEDDQQILLSVLKKRRGQKEISSMSSVELSLVKKRTPQLGRWGLIDRATGGFGVTQKGRDYCHTYLRA